MAEAQPFNKPLTGMVVVCDRDAVLSEDIKKLEALGATVIEKKAGTQVTFVEGRAG